MGELTETVRGIIHPLHLRSGCTAIQISREIHMRNLAQLHAFLSFPFPLLCCAFLSSALPCTALTALSGRVGTSQLAVNNGE
jgi:hypothetical protein